MSAEKYSILLATITLAATVNARRITHTSSSGFSNSGFGSGKIAGIVIGSIVGFIVLCLCVYVLFQLYLRRRTRTVAPTSTAEAHPGLSVRRFSSRNRYASMGEVEGGPSMPVNAYGKEAVAPQPYGAPKNSGYGYDV